MVSLTTFSLDVRRFPLPAVILRTCESHHFHHFLPLLRNILGLCSCLLLCLVSFHWLSRLPKTDPISHCLLTHIPLPEPRLSPYSLLGLSNLFSPLCHSPLLIFQVFTDSLSLDICSLCCIT